RQMMALFGGKQRPSESLGPGVLHDSRTTLQVEILCKPVVCGPHHYLLSIELKLGTVRRYTAQRIRELLACLGRGSECVISRYFEYKPSVHEITPEHAALLRQLMEVHRYESLYRDTAALYEERSLVIPPHAWTQVLAILTQTPSVKLEVDLHSYDGLA